MSRSYKRYPILRQERVHKKSWNRSVRRKKVSYSLRGSQYKKIKPNWNSWSYMWTEDDAIRNYSPSKRFPTLSSWLIHWKRCCLWK